MGKGPHFGLWHDMPKGWVRLTWPNYYSGLGRHNLKEYVVQRAGCAGPKETTRNAIMLAYCDILTYHPVVSAHCVSPLDSFKYYFLLFIFSFYYMSNAFNTPVNNYITISLKSEKVNQ